ncbi:MAG: enoyl-[acyl-carrier-protein] reductase FabK [Moorellales bacterium]
MLRTPLCDLLDIDYPILQGGMAWAGTGELAGAVSAAGGLGIIGAADFPPEVVAQEIAKVRRMTDRPFGVNIMLMSRHVDEVVRLVIREKVPVVTTGGGNPGKYLAALKEAGIKVLPVVSSVALARRLARSGVDGFIAEGMESGGHIGEVATLPLVPQVVDAVEEPVVAAGGIADGRGLVAALALGAVGIQMGTRFLCSIECPAHARVKERIVQAKDRDTVVTGALTGHPVRVLRNRLSRQFEQLEKSGAPVEEIAALGVGKLRAAIVEGDVEYGSVMAGQISGLIRDVRPVREILESIVSEAEAILETLTRVVSPNGNER